MPLFAKPPKAEAGLMRQSTLVLSDPLIPRPSRLTDRVLARVFGASLDRQLAAGTEPETTPLLAARAQDIVAAEPDIRDLISRLTTPLPVTAQGVAMASVLLTDATGPVYRRRGPITLDTAIAAAIAQLDPALPLMR
jgi:hypothetical protein